MAGVDYDTYAGYGAQDTGEGAGHGSGAINRLAGFAGAASSFALVIGLGIWGYQLTMRDVREVPVIRALEGPARVQPEDPGGTLAQHQGLAVNNVQSEGQAEGPAPQVILAPPPLDLAQTDLERDVPPVVASEGKPALFTPDETQVQPTQIVARTVPGVSLSPRPKGRPATRPARSEATPQGARFSAIEAALFQAIEVDPADIAAGTRLVQLGAFDDRAAAEAAWTGIVTRFEDYMEGKQMTVQKATSGGRDIYRLRAVGFADLSGARRFCSVLVAEKASCIPVVAR